METYSEVSTAQTRSALKRAGRAIRWLGLLYGDRKGPVPCSKSVLEVELRGFEPLTPSMRRRPGRWPGVARHRAPRDLPAKTVAGRSLVSLHACRGWLPTWLPANSLAALTWAAPAGTESAVVRGSAASRAVFKQPTAADAGFGRAWPSRRLAVGQGLWVEADLYSVDPTGAGRPGSSPKWQQTISLLSPWTLCGRGSSWKQMSCAIEQRG